ncbi:MAG: cytidylyltransferase domain-containing protein [Phycisphaeraceae bacterium JB051]
MTKTVAIIQARMGSTRLPGKVLKTVADRPMLSYMLDRLSTLVNSEHPEQGCLQEIVIATTGNVGDQPIVEFCESENVDCFLGDEDDVLMRYYEAARHARADVVVRMTADCPLIDPRIVEQVVSFYHEHASEYDFVANTVPPPGTFPDGMDVEVFPFEMLEKAHMQAQLPSHREHVTFFMWNTGKFRSHRYDLPTNLSDYRFTLDYPQDLQIITAVLTRLYPEKPQFTLDELIQFMDSHQSLRELQQGIVRNAGWQRAFDADQQFEQRQDNDD